MLISREAIEKKVNILLSEYNAKRVTRDKVVKYFVAKGFFPGEIQDIFSKRRPIEMVSDLELCLMTIALSQVDDSIIPSKFFNKNEIHIAEQFSKTNETESKFPIVLEKVLQVDEDRWFTFLDLQTISKLYNSGAIIYNPETQRNLKIKEFENNIVKEININKIAVQEIKQLMLENKFIFNTLTFNLQQDGEEEFEYDSKKSKFIITKGNIAVLDGWHRSLSMLYALQENPELNGCFEVRITYFDTDKAKAFIVQEDKKNKINAQYIKSLDTNKLSNLIVKKLNENSNSYLRGKITTDKIYIKKGKALIMFDVLSDAIEFTFKPMQNADIIQQGKFILNGLNYILEEHEGYLDETNELIWSAFIVMLSKVYKNKNWQASIDVMLKKMRVIKEMYCGNINKGTIKKLEEVIVGV
jgi:putative sterol carrier protein